MRHRISGGLIPKTILAALCAIAFACAQAPVAFAQRGGGGHVSAPHMSAPHMAAPPARPSAPSRVAPPPRPAAAPQVRPPISRPMPSAPPPAGFGTPGFRTRHPRPIRPGPPFRRPVQFPPIFISPIFPPFGFGFGFNSFWPSFCGPALFWNFGCGVGPSYGYGLGFYGPYAGPSYPYESAPYVGPVYPAPLNVYGGAERDLVELCMKDGTVYDVLDYWVVDNQLHFTTNDGGDTPTEHVVSLDDLDMQKTIDVNTQRGFNFMLRNEPIEQYLQDHPDAGSPSTDAPQDQLLPAAPEDQSPTTATPQDQYPAPEAEPQTQPSPQEPTQPPAQ